MAEQVTPLDLERMFMGTQPPLFVLEIVVRVLLIYGFAALMIRLMGKRGRRELSPFELLVRVIALGSATGDSMFYPDVPILHAWMVILVVVGCDVGMAHLQYRYTRVQRFVESTPRLVIRHGAVDSDALHAELLRLDELYSMLREKSVSNTWQCMNAPPSRPPHASVGCIQMPSFAASDLAASGPPCVGQRSKSASSPMSGMRKMNSASPKSRPRAASKPGGPISLRSAFNRFSQPFRNTRNSGRFAARRR